MLLAAWLVLPVTAVAQDASVEVTQAALTKLVQRLGPFAEAGVYTPSSPAGNTGGMFQNCQVLGWLDCPSPLGGREIHPLLSCKPRPSLKLSGGREFSLAKLPRFTVVAAADPPATYEWSIVNPAITVNSGSMTFTATVSSRVGTQTNSVTQTVPASIGWDAASRRLRMNVSAFMVPLQAGSGTVANVDVARFYTIALAVEPQAFSIPLPNGTTRNINARPLSATVQYQAGRAVLSFDLGF
jgi:hypothetical protein